jgi:nicotinamide-nucleotide amidase
MTQQRTVVSLCIIGTEITRGIIADKHGNLLSRELTNLGYEVNRIIIVPDDGSLEPMLRQCANEADIIILTGGLGPTSDDMTRQVVADLAQVPLVQDDEAYQRLYERIGDRIHGANQRQVCFPKGFRVIPNAQGTAPGFTGTITLSSGHLVTCYAMPGPPVEMHAMLYTYVLPELAQAAGVAQHGRQEYACFLTPESKLEEVCYATAKKGILWGTRVQEYRISLYISGADEADREAMATAASRQLGPGLLVKGDLSVPQMLSDLLRERSMHLATAESCTGGLIGKMMTDLPGSSDYYWGGVVSYKNDAKSKLLGVPQSLIQTYGAVSEETVQAMAESVRNLSGAEISIAISGIAGPDGGTEEKPVGTVCFAFSGSDRETVALRLTFSSYGRSSVRRRAAVAALLLAYFYVKGDDLLDISASWQYI